MAKKYSVIVDGYTFDSGLKKSAAESLVELLKDQFPGAILKQKKDRK